VNRVAAEKLREVVLSIDCESHWLLLTTGSEVDVVAQINQIGGFPPAKLGDGGEESSGRRHSILEEQARYSKIVVNDYTQNTLNEWALALIPLHNEDQKIIYAVGFHEILCVAQFVSRLRRFANDHIFTYAVIFPVAIAINDANLGPRFQG
jgi:hypothetical protein